jgi:cytochrome c oxidase assembly protein subunit 15
VCEGAGRLQGLAVSTAALAYVQLVLGAHVRHLPDGTSLETFRLFVIFHLLMAVVVTMHVLLLNLRVRRQFRDEPLLRRPALLLGGLIVLQLSLGLATWAVHYGVPQWFSGTFGLGAGYTVEADSLLQAHLTTAHVAGGQLIFAIATMVALRSLRLLRREPVPAPIGRKLAGVAL